MTDKTITLHDALALIDARTRSYHDAAQNAGRPQDARKYLEGANALASARLDLQVLAEKGATVPCANCRERGYTEVWECEITVH